MDEFKTKRESLDGILEEVKSCIKEKSVSRSMQHLDKAKGLLAEIKKMAEGNIQERIVTNRVNEIEYLERQIENILSKRGREKGGWQYSPQMQLE